MKVYETENFVVEAPEKPHISREDGGHLKIVPKERILDRTKLAPEKAKELMKLTMIVGEAMAIGMNYRGVDVGRINYQDMGNWTVFKPEGSYLHIHIYGRAKSAKVQKYGDAMKLPQRGTGFYDDFKPLNEEDAKEIQKQIEIVSKREKYQEKNW